MAHEVHFECVDFFFGQHIGLSAGLQCLIGESACHFEEHCSLECIVEVLTHHHLSVLEQLYGVAGLHCFYHSIGQFGAAGTRKNGISGITLPTYSGTSAVTLMLAGRSFEHARSVAYGLWK